MPLHFDIKKSKNLWGFPWGLKGKESAYNAGGLGSVSGSERSPGEGHDYPSCMLTWRIPRIEVSGGLQSMGLQRVIHN